MKTVSRIPGYLSVLFVLLLLALAPAARATTYFSNGPTGDPTVTTSWTNSAGANPANFTTAGDTFVVLGVSTYTMAAAWSVAGNLQINTSGTLAMATSATVFDLSVNALTNNGTFKGPTAANCNLNITNSLANGGSFTLGNSGFSINIIFTGNSTWTGSGDISGSKISVIVNVGKVLDISNLSPGIKFRSSGSQAFTVNGTLLCGTTTINGNACPNAKFVLGASGTLSTANVNGITNGIGTLGTITNFVNTGSTNGITLPTTANYVFNGAGAQSTLGLPATVANFTNANTGGVLTLSSSVAVTGTAAVNAGATLNFNGNNVTDSGGASKFIVASGGGLQITDATGINASGASGNVQTTTRTFDTAGNYTYSGTGAQATGSGLPATVNTFTDDNTGGTLTLAQPATFSSVVLVSGAKLSLPAGTSTSLTLVIGGAFQASGTWGNAGSGATHINATDFAGTGQLLALVASTPVISTAAGGVWGATTTWVGSVVPTSGQDVVIATTGVGFVALDSVNTVNSLIINLGAQFSMSSAGINQNLTINGNLVNNGSFMRSGGTPGTANTIIFAGAPSLWTGSGNLTTNKVSVTVNADKTLDISGLTTGMAFFAGTLSFTVNGTLIAGTQVITGGGTSTTFTLAGGATLVTANVNGITNDSTCTIYNFTKTGSPALSTTANYVFNGTANQSTLGLPATVNNLTASNTVAQVLLSVNETVSGALTIGSGTLTINSAGQLSSGAFAGLITNNAAFNYASSANQSLSGVISGTGSLTNAGSGTLTISAANTYSGTTTVNGGMLLINGNSSGVTNAVNVLSGATYGSTNSGFIGGVVAYYQGAKALFTVTPTATGYSNSTYMTFTNTSLFTNTTVYLNLPTALGNGTYVLATNIGSAPTLTGSFTFATNSGNLGTGGSGALTISGKNLVLTVSGVSSGAAITGSTNFINAFSTIYSTASAAQSYAVTGASLMANITNTAAPGFEVSSDGGVTYGGTAIVTNVSGSATGSVYIRLTATAPAGSYDSSNSVVMTSTGATSLTNRSSASGNIISAKAASVTANPQTKTYGNVNPVLTAVTNGAVNGDVVNVTIATTVTQYSAVGVSNITVTAGSNPNYTVLTTNSTLTINPASTFVGATSTKNPSGYNESVVYIATLPADATGSVVFSSTNGPISTNTVSGGSANSLSITNLPRGANVITVAYLGDGNYLGSSTNIDQIVTNHPPSANMMTMTRTAGMALKIKLSDIATNWSDVDDDSVKLIGVTMQSTNGVNLMALSWTTNLNGTIATTNNAYLGYTNSPNVADQISYGISDGQGGTNIGYVNIIIRSSVTGTNLIASLVSGNPTLLTAYGIPYFSYITERSTNLSSWVDISTNAAATNGVINITDSFSDLGGIPPVSAYYRLKWQP